MFYFALLQILMKQQMSNFLTYTAENFESVINSAEEIVNILDVDPVFPKIRKKKKKIKFDYEANDEQINNPKDN
jgi:Zn-dependent M32 family carboxypeptidase